MKIEALVGDVLAVPAGVLISMANPWLQMTGGVNLQIILRPRGEFVHEELQRHLRDTGRLISCRNSAGAHYAAITCVSRPQGEVFGVLRCGALGTWASGSSRS